MWLVRGPQRRTTAPALGTTKQAAEKGGESICSQILTFQVDSSLVADVIMWLQSHLQEGQEGALCLRQRF
jgi:hypothetical protein